jgi:predicted phosphodiesterase
VDVIKHDFDLIVHELAPEIGELRLYPLGDLHIGSSDFDEVQWYKWKKMVLEDEFGYVVIVGDLMDNGLKNSKTDAYSATMRPFEQKQWLKRELGDFKHKILGGVRGNHEGRSQIESDDCPMYDVFSKLDIEDLYRENMAFLKLNFGRRNATRQRSYTVVLGHGASKSKTNQFSYAIDGMDVLVTGHTHSGSSDFRSKLVIDKRNNSVSLESFTHIVVPSFQKMGGYALRAMYLPQDHCKIPVIEFDEKEKNVKVTWL